MTAKPPTDDTELRFSLLELGAPPKDAKPGEVAPAVTAAPVTTPDPIGTRAPDQRVVRNARVRQAEPIADAVRTIRTDVPAALRRPGSAIAQFTEVRPQITIMEAGMFHQFDAIDAPPDQIARLRRLIPQLVVQVTPTSREGDVFRSLATLADRGELMIQRYQVESGDRDYEYATAIGSDGGQHRYRRSSPRCRIDLELIDASGEAMHALSADADRPRGRRR